MVATVLALRKGRATKFPGPDHQSSIQKPALSEVRQQAGNRFIDGLCILRVSIHKVRMLIPSITIATGAGEFNKPDATFDQPTRQQALLSKCRCVWKLIEDAVHLLSLSRLFGQIHQIRHGELHSGGEFVVLNRRLDLIIVAKSFGGLLIQLSNKLPAFVAEVPRWVRGV